MPVAVALREALVKVTETEDLDGIVMSVPIQVAQEDVKVNGTAENLPSPPRRQSSMSV